MSTILPPTTDKQDRTGLPRPNASPGWETDADGERTDVRRRALPLPWINGAPDADGSADFYAFRDDCRRAEVDRLCCICGDALGPLVVIAAMSGAAQTSGGWGHPRCIQLSVQLCPHFRHHDDEPIVAWLHRGPGVGVVEPATFEVDDIVGSADPVGRDELAHLAKADPWGERPGGDDA